MDLFGANVQSEPELCHFRYYFALWVVIAHYLMYLWRLFIPGCCAPQVIQTSMAEVRLLGGDSSDLLSSNNVSLHEVSHCPVSVTPPRKNSAQCYLAT